MSGAVAGHVEQIFLTSMQDIASEEYAPALFWAGRYESLTDEDERDYILDCFEPSQELTNLLFEAQEAYIMSDRRTGYVKMAETRNLYKEAMVNCPRVWNMMNEILKQADGMMSSSKWSTM